MRSWLSETSPEEAAEWESAMLDHPFGEDEWAEARTRLKNLLHQDAREAGEESMLAYLCCFSLANIQRFALVRACCANCIDVNKRQLTHC